jgi:hypothetical protein
VPATYDDTVSSVPTRDLLPGGIFSTRRQIRRIGGLMGIVIAISLWLTGVIAGWLLPGIVGGAMSFVLMVMALPVMPILGMPAVGGSSRLLMAMALSATLWWILGQVVGIRVAQRPVVGWREWLKEFMTLSLGLWIGAAMALALGALALGAL